MVLPGGIDLDQFLATNDKEKIGQAIKDSFKDESASSFEDLIDDKNVSDGLIDDDRIRLGAAKAYISRIKYHRIINDIKARNLGISTWLLFSCIMSIGLIAFFVWIYLPALVR